MDAQSVNKLSKNRRAGTKLAKPNSNSRPTRTLRFFSTACQQVTFYFTDSLVSHDKDSDRSQLAPLATPRKKKPNVDLL